MKPRLLKGGDEDLNRKFCSNDLKVAQTTANLGENFVINQSVVCLHQIINQYDASIFIYFIVVPF